jgi:hypothetical protein
MRIADADPPYPGLSRKYYRDEPTYAGEVDHAALVARLVAGYDGWALSTSAAALQNLLPLCPAGIRVCGVSIHGAGDRCCPSHRCTASPVRRYRPAGMASPV